MVHRIVPLALAVLALMGCASPSERRVEVRDDESFAMHILRAADIGGLRDAPREAAMSISGLETGAVGVSDIGRVGHVALSAANPLGGASALGAGLGAGLLSFFLVPGDAPAESSAIVAWVPAEYAATPEEAQTYLMDVLERTMLPLMEQHFPDATSVKPVRSAELVGNGVPERRGVVAEWEGGKCADLAFQRCRIGAGMFGRDLPLRRAPPKILAGSDAWQFSRLNGAITIRPAAQDDDFRQHFRARFDEISFYAEVSERLPEWVFIYIAPNRIGFRDQTGDLKLYPLPMILNQGRAHYFVKGARGGQDLQTSF
jgi:hypothetical protein